MNMKKNLSNKKINILYLHAGAEMYGADKILLEIVTNLDQDLYKPLVILPNEGVLVYELQKRNIEVAVVNYPILRRKYFNIQGVFNYAVQYIKYSKLLSKIVFESKINIIHVNTSAVLEGIYLKKKNKIPLIWHIHEIIMNPTIVYKLTSFLVNRYSSSIITVSNAVKEHLIDSKMVDANKVKVIYNGISNLNFDFDNIKIIKKNLELTEDNLVIGMIGRINSWKGQLDFIESVTPLLNRYSHLKILLVGGTFEGEEWRKTELIDKISKIKQKDNIILIDFQDNIADYHQLIDIFVLPSTNPDPFPTVVLEAMSLGKPIVGYNHGGIKEMISTPELYLATPKDTSELSRKIELLITDKESRIREGILNKNKQRTLFNKENYNGNIQDLYQSILNKEER